MATKDHIEVVEPYNGLYADRNDAIAVEVTDEHLIVTTRDGRIVHVPLEWFPWLENAAPEQRADFENNKTSIHWNSLDEGVSTQVILLGRYKD
jgi:hypothetical protein